MAFTALYDACVLFPAPVRDLLLHLAVTDQFRARWTDAIHEEWIRAVLNSRPDLSRKRLERTRRSMDAHVRDALITDFEDLIPTLTLPDPDDRHVLAAAIRGRAAEGLLQSKPSPLSLDQPRLNVFLAYAARLNWRYCAMGRPRQLSRRRMPSALSIYFSYSGSEWPRFIL